MKRLFLLVCLLTLLVTTGLPATIEVPEAPAWMLIGGGTPEEAPGGGFCDGSSELECTDFEETGAPTADNGAWSSSGDTIYWDCTTGDCPLADDESLQAADSAAGTRVATLDLTSTTASFYASMMFKISALPATEAEPLRITDSAGTADLAAFSITTGGGVRVTDDTLFSTSFATISADTLYYLYIYYIAGSGANGQIYGCIETTTSSWSTCGSITTSARMANADKLEVQSWHARNYDITVDNLIVDDSAININRYQ